MGPGVAATQGLSLFWLLCRSDSPPALDLGTVRSTELWPAESGARPALSRDGRFCAVVHLSKHEKLDKLGGFGACVARQKPAWRVRSPQQQ
jgi:hypothetical protein